MSGQVSLNAFDYAVLIVYLLATIALGFWVSRRGVKTTRDYFLGGRNIPWYVVGASIVATDISSEHFIANVGAAYQYGMVVAAPSWNTWIIYSLLIWVFLPYYFRSGISTMPEFLERRYNVLCRHIFALFLIVGYIGGIIAGSLYAGGVTLDSIFGLNLNVGVWLFAGAT